MGESVLGKRRVADGAPSVLHVVGSLAEEAETVPASAAATTRVAVKASHTLQHLLIAYGLCLAVPIALYVAAGARHPIALVLVHYVVATACALTALVMTVEVVCAWKRRPTPNDGLHVLPRAGTVTCIVSAYLPNEQHLIMETLIRLSANLNISNHRVQVILAYNSPQYLPVEETLRAYAALNPNFIPLRVDGSRSKAENVHAAVALATGEMTVLLDADHHLLSDAVERAWRWLERGYDVVQGRCVVRNQKLGLLTRWVAIEFEQVYAILHAGRSMGFDIAIFGGSNGYWRTSVLREISMDPSMLTEDIDATVRATLQGYRFVHDRSIVASELAPATLEAWWSQRLRWAQGWLQVTMKHQPAILASGRLSWKQKAYWTYLLTWRELYPVLSIQAFGLLGAAVLLQQPIGWFSNGYFVATAAITLAAGPLATVAAYRRALWRTKSRLRLWFIGYALFSLPYTMLKNSVGMAAQVRQVVDRSGEWVITNRAPLSQVHRGPEGATDPMYAASQPVPASAGANSR